MALSRRAGPRLPLKPMAEKLHQRRGGRSDEDVDRSSCGEGWRWRWFARCGVSKHSFRNSARAVCPPGGEIHRSATRWPKWRRRDSCTAAASWRFLSRVVYSQRDGMPCNVLPSATLPLPARPALPCISPHRHGPEYTALRDCSACPQGRNTPQCGASRQRSSSTTEASLHDLACYVRDLI